MVHVVGVLEDSSASWGVYKGSGCTPICVSLPGNMKIAVILFGGIQRLITNKHMAGL